MERAGPSRAATGLALTDLASCIVVVQVHERTRRVAILRSRLARVDERLGEGAAVGDVVRTAGPLETLGRSRVDRPVAPAPLQATGAARPRHGVRHTCGRDGVHEGCLPRTWPINTATCGLTELWDETHNKGLGLLYQCCTSFALMWMKVKLVSNFTSAL